MKIEVIKLPHFAGDKVSYATPGSAAIDLCYSPDARDPQEISREDLFTPKLLSTGLKMHIADPDYVGILAARSSLGHKLDIQLSNGIGVIDSDYRGEIFVSAVSKVPLYQESFPQEDSYIGPEEYYLALSPERKETLFKRGDRIAQIMIVPVKRVDLEFVEEFSQSSKRTGGFGSTG